MSYRIVAKPRAWWPVIWNVVTEDGAVAEAKIRLRFVLHKVDDREVIESAVQEKIRAAVQAKVDGDTATESGLYRDALKLFAEDWDDVQDEQGKDLSWSDENVRLLMNEPGVFDHCIAAYRVCMAGGREIREGN
ncbi:hypothetical protein HY78_00495 [Rhizorhabdus wittichii DC-6]|nr:hypothetical protein HY78_00495 [Rhizorhabdus wittichii DC-6]